MVYIHPDVDYEWKTCSRYQLNSYLNLQLKGFNICLAATDDALKLNQNERDLQLLIKFLVQCYNVVKKYARVCISFHHSFILPTESSLIQQVHKFVAEIESLIRKICSEVQLFIDRRKVYILIRVLCKSKLTLEKYLVHIDYWRKTGKY